MLSALSTSAYVTTSIMGAWLSLSPWRAAVLCRVSVFVIFVIVADSAFSVFQQCISNPFTYASGKLHGLGHHCRASGIENAVRLDGPPLVDHGSPQYRSKWYETARRMSQVLPKHRTAVHEFVCRQMVLGNLPNSSLGYWWQLMISDWELGWMHFQSYLYSGTIALIPTKATLFEKR